MRLLNRFSAFLFTALLPTAAYGQTLQRLFPATRSRIEVFVDGNLKNVIGEPGEGTNAAGSLGIRYVGKTYLATGLINVAGTGDTITQAFGATMLAPSSGTGLNAGLLDIRRRHLWPSWDETCRRLHQEQDRHPLRCNIGIHLYASASSARWATQVDSNGVVVEAVGVPVLGTGLGLSYTFATGSIGTADDPKGVGMVLDVGLATRHLRGDLFDQTPTRLALLSSTDRDFYGYEIGLSLQYDQLRAGFTYYRLTGDVPGLSDGQVVAGVSLQANLNSGELNREGAAPRGAPTPEE
jgi:hypothetical protein